MLLKVCSLFSGIAGLELGFAAAGCRVIQFCELDDAARAVLAFHFPDVPMRQDVGRLRSLPACDIVTAGWPCQDLSQAGKTAGLDGSRSGLIHEVFRLLRTRNVEWVVLENVQFALFLKAGAAIRAVTRGLEELGYRWAYRVLDTRDFGLPQRRRRIFIVAAKSHDPASALAGPLPSLSREQDTSATAPCGFYWTEGRTGIGWAQDAIPPLKGGSNFAIPSPPGIWLPETGSFVAPGIEDAEALQGFPRGWTGKADQVSRKSVRWKLVGNAVSVPVATWVAKNICRLLSGVTNADHASTETTTGLIVSSDNRAQIPVQLKVPATASHLQAGGLADFLKDPKPLSSRALIGFATRLQEGGLRARPDFAEALYAEVATLKRALAA